MSSTKHIGIVIPLLRRGGGAENVCSWLVRELARAGWQTNTITFWRRDNEYAIPGERYVIPLARFALVNMVRRAHYLARLAKKQQLTTLLSFTEEANAATLLARWFGYRGHLVVAVRNNPDVRSWWSRFFIRHTYRLADVVVANSREMATMLREKYALGDRVRCINNPIDVIAAQKAAAMPLELDVVAESFIFLTIGRMIEQKAQANLLRAFAAAAREQALAELWILGAGVLDQQLKRLAVTLSITDQVRFLGVQENVYPYLKRANCFVFTSRFEGFPNVLGEALALDIPVVATDCYTGVRELLDPKLGHEAITYPHKGEYGTLVAVPVESFYDARPLTKEEEQLSQVMNEAVRTHGESVRARPGGERVRALDPQTIFAEWQTVLAS